MLNRNGITITEFTFKEIEISHDTKYFWHVKASNDGETSNWSEAWSFTTITLTAVNDDTDNEIPKVFSLSQNYPNPFNPTTTIQYTLPYRVYVKLTIFNSLGEKIQTLVNKTQDAGEYKVKWNPISVTSGIYVYRLQAGEFNETKKNDFSEMKGIWPNEITMRAVDRASGELLQRLEASVENSGYVESRLGK